MSNPKGINQYTKRQPGAVSQARVNTTKGNHRPGWMLRADPKLAALVKRNKAPRSWPRA